MLIDHKVQLTIFVQYYDFRVVIYNHRGFIRLVTGRTVQIRWVHPPSLLSWARRVAGSSVHNCGSECLACTRSRPGTDTVKLFCPIDGLVNYGSSGSSGFVCAYFHPAVTGLNPKLTTLAFAFIVILYDTIICHWIVKRWCENKQKQAGFGTFNNYGRVNFGHSFEWRFEIAPKSFHKKN